MILFSPYWLPAWLAAIVLLGAAALVQDHLEQRRRRPRR
jgi:hypothetical protein